MSTRGGLRIAGDEPVPTEGLERACVLAKASPQGRPRDDEQGQGGDKVRVGEAPTKARVDASPSS
jgi:hypothetical protein